MAVNSDRLAAHEAYVPQHLRLEVVRSNSYVDEVVLLDEPVTDLISRLKPAIVVKGKEHESRANPELAAIQEYGGALLFGSGELAFSSLDIPTAWQVMYSSTIRSPTTHTLSPPKLFTRLPSRAVVILWRSIKSLGRRIVDKFVSRNSWCSRSKEEKASSPEPKSNVPPYSRIAASSGLARDSCSLPFTTIAGFSRAMRSVTGSSSRTTSSPRSCQKQ